MNERACVVLFRIALTFFMYGELLKPCAFSAFVLAEKIIPAGRVIARVAGRRSPRWRSMAIDDGIALSELTLRGRQHGLGSEKQRDEPAECHADE